jgi:hypothetical protein
VGQIKIVPNHQPAMVEAPFFLWCAIGSGHGPSPFLAPFDSPPLREQIDTAAPLAPGDRDRTATTHGETMVEYTFHIYLSIYLSISLSFKLSIYLAIYLSI